MGKKHASQYANFGWLRIYSVKILYLKSFDLLHIENAKTTMYKNIYAQKETGYIFQ